MSAIEGKGDPSTSAISENILSPDEPDLIKPTDDAENKTKSSNLGVGVTKKDENDGNLVSKDLGTVEKDNFVDANQNSDLLPEGDKIIDETAPIATESSKTISREVPSTSKVTKDDLETTFEHKTSNTNEQKSIIDDKILKQDHIIPLDPVSQDNVPKDPDVELDKTKESISLVGSDNNPFHDSFEGDLELKWEYDEKDDEYSTNLSEEALKSLDKELGIDEKVVDNTNSDRDIMENIDNVDTCTKIDTEQTVFNETKDVNSSTNPDINSKSLNEKAAVSGSDTTIDIAKDDDFANQIEQIQPEPIILKEVTSINKNKIIKDVPQKSDKMQITEDTIGMDTSNISANSDITSVVEMDVDLMEDSNNMELIDPKQSNIIVEDSQIKIDTTTAINEIYDIPLKVKETQAKTLQEDCIDIDKTEKSDQCLQEIDSSEKIEENLFPTKNEVDLSTQETPIDKADKFVSDKDLKNTETNVLNENEEPSITKGMKTDLGLNKPDVMLEIPTQELIDIDELDDSSEIDKEIIESDVSFASNYEQNTSTLETKSLLEDNIITNDKNIKLTTEQQTPTTKFEEKDLTVTELVKIATKKEQSVESTENFDKNSVEIEDKIDNPIPSDDNVTESNSTVNDNEITRESTSKVIDDCLTVNIDKNNVIKETTSDLNVTVEPMSTSGDDNTPVLTTTTTDENIKVEPISKLIDNSITEYQTSKADDSIITKDTSNVDENMIAETSTDNLKITEITSDKMTEETLKLDKIMTSEPISKPNDRNLTEDNTAKESSTNNQKMKTEISKNTQEASKEDSKTSKLDENKTAEEISEANDDKMTNESSANDSIEIEPSKDKKPSFDVSMTAELCKDNPNTTETTSKGDVDMAEDPEISDSLGLLAESSRVMDDDDQDEDDDSDDFDQDDESSNLQTAEHSEESNPSDEAQREGKDIPIPEDDNNEEDTNIGMDIVDDIVCEETDIIEKVGAIIKLEIDSAIIGNENLQKESQSEVKDTSTPTDTSKKDDGSALKELLLDDAKQDDETKKTPSKSTRLSIKNMKEANIMTYVDLEESSDDDIQEIKREKPEDNKEESVDVTEEKNVEENKPKPTLKMTKLNTSEVTIKTGMSSKPPLIIPEISNVSEIEKPRDNLTVKKQNLEEIYNIDSDTDEEVKETPLATSQTKFNPKCINAMCTSPSTDQHYVADAAAMRHYGATKRRAICAPCLASVDTRNEALVKGIKDLTPLLELNMEKPTNLLVEISDSESEDESDLIKECNEFIGQEGAKMLNEKLADLINDVWQKFNMDDRLKDSENFINKELIRLEDESTEIDKLLNECQAETDTIRNELYKTFEKNAKILPPICILDTPTVNYTCLEKDDTYQHPPSSYLRSALEEPPAKRQNRSQTETNTEEVQPTTANEATKQSDDDRDVSVVLLSAESAPDDLPPPGEMVRPPLRVGMAVHAMRNAFGSWLRGRILDIQPKAPGQQYTHCRIKFDHNIKNPCKVLPARCIAYQEPCSVRMTIGTRVLALFKDTNKRESFYSGVVAEIPNPVNSYRYLVFFDDGYAQYVKHKDTRLVCESKSTVWEEVHPFIRDFVKDYLMKYPERPMVRLHAGQKLNTEWNGKWWTSKVLQVDASLAQVHFEEDDRTEWIYRGSTRLAPLYLELQAAGRSRTRLPRSKAQYRTNMPYVEYMRSEEQTKQQQQLQQEEMIRRQRAVAKKSVSLPQPTPMVDKPDNVTSRVVYYTPKNAVKPYKMVPHTCSPQCRRTDVLSLKELRTYNPLAKPLLSGWERMQVRFKGSKHIMYRAPCGRRIRDMIELHRYLRAIDSDLSVDLFDFNVNTHCLAEFVLHKYNVMKKDLSHGKESVPVPCVNYYDDSLPEFCSYNTERTPTAGVPLNIDPDFLCGCDCEDDCEDKSKCACWKMTLEGARTIGLDSPNVGYVYRRLPEPLPSGIYECNSRCKCKSTCLNRVAQHPLQLKLQVFKTLKRGWGIRALNDVPKGSFLCVYAGNLLTDATANLDGLNEGDEYLAELDYIEVVEQMKEGFEEDIPEADKKLDKKESKQSSSEDEETESEEDSRDSDKDDNDFQPGYIGLGLTEFNKRLRKRGKKRHNDGKDNVNDKDRQKTNDCITISDDEEVREPSRFTAQAGMGDKGFISKYRSVRTLFGKDEACYIMDAKVQGNIGRYLNHSCCPNVFVQNVFVDTHDPRFPWVAFFALSHIRAGTELTWNYNYDIGSVPGKILYCYCGAHNCRGRLL